MTPRRVMITGGMRSGKSRFAEGLLADQPHVTYIAPGPPPDPATDSEWAERIAEHRETPIDELDDPGDHRRRRRSPNGRPTFSDRLPGHLADCDNRPARHLGATAGRLAGAHLRRDGQTPAGLADVLRTGRGGDQ